jgi:CBS domain-containing protein
MLEKEMLVLAKLLKNVKVEEVMGKPARTINVNDDFSVAEEIFVKHKLRHLPVVGNDGKLVGVISQRDVYRAIAPRRFIDGTVYFREGIIVDQDGYYEKESLNKFIINSIMRKNPSTLTPDQSLGEAIHILVKEKVGCVPIVDKNMKVVGIITRFDFLKFADRIYSSQL